MGVKIYRGWTILIFVILAIGLPLLGVFLLTSLPSGSENVSMVSDFCLSHPGTVVFCLVFFVLFWVIFILVTVLNHGLSIGVKKGRFEGVGVSARWV